MNEPYRILLAALQPAHAGQTWTVDGWREQADLGQLTSAERGAAHEHAVDDGYLVPLGGKVGDTFHTFTIPTTHPAGKGRRVIVYARTAKALPGQPAPTVAGHDPEQIDGQTDLLEMVGGA